MRLKIISYNFNMGIIKYLTWFNFNKFYFSTINAKKFSFKKPIFSCYVCPSMITFLWKSIFHKSILSKSEA